MKNNDFESVQNTGKRAENWRQKNRSQSKRKLSKNRTNSSLKLEQEYRVVFTLSVLTKQQTQLNKNR